MNFMYFTTPHRMVFVLSALLTSSTYATSREPLDIIVTAGRKAQTTRELLTPVTVITRADIQKWQATDVPDVLRRIPSLNSVNQGGAGKLTNIFLRGTNANHVRVLIDGIQMGSATAGLTAFEYLPLEQIERIEVVRGARSSLYGSEAIGGVIQIFTRRDTAKGFKPSASVSVGTGNTRKAHINLAGGRGTTWYNLNVGKEKTAGINALESYQDWSSFPPLTVYETDRDGFKSDSASLRAGHRFVNNVSLEATALQAKGFSQFDGALQNESTFKQQVLATKANIPITKRTVVNVQLGQSRDELDSLKDGRMASRFNTLRDSAHIIADMRLTELSRFNFGVDYQRDHVESDTAYTVTTRHNHGVLVNYQNRWGVNHLEVAARHDNNQQFGAYETGSLSLGRDINPNTRVLASYATAFKAPTFNDLYYPAAFGFTANPNLKPEQAQTLELGLQGQLQQGQWALRAFETQIRDLINYQYDPLTFTGTMQNTAQARIQGLEAEMARTQGAWTWSINATLQKPENRTGLNQGKVLARRPQAQFKAELDRQWGQGSVGASLNSVGKRYEDATNQTVLAGYSTLDLRARYPLTKHLALGLKVSNVLDKSYQTALGYSQLRRNGLMTLTYSPH